MSEVATRLFPALADRYRIEREIGSGGMATVYLARDLKHDRDVALKVLRPELAAVLGADRFLNEIKITARLDHPHILTLIDSGAADGFLYYVMPFVRGESLRDRLDREKQLGVDEALDISKQITSALDYAHRQGVVHRDIKPENILIHEGEAVLADFGIAMAVKEAGGNRLTETGLSLGTPQYMSPEQATGDRALDSRSDVYSMAAVLYEMLAGEPPHSGATVQAIIAKLMTERPTRLRVMRDTVPEGIDTAVAKALAKIPADRYANAGDFARALTAASVAQQSPVGSRRWLPLAIGGGIAAIAAIAAAVLLSRKPAPAPQLDRVQATVTGNAVAPSLSPDGTRIAFAEKQCDAGGYCTYQLVIQDTDGSSRLVIASNAAGIWRTSWSPDSRFIIFTGSYGSARWGAFAVSTLGGPVRHFGCCGIDLVSGDTASISVGMAAGDTIAWIRRVTAHDGQTLDSIPLHKPGVDYDVTPLPYPDRLLVSVRQTFESAPELRLIDFRGAVLDRKTPGFGYLGRALHLRWAQPTRRLLIASQRDPSALNSTF
jgi:serine/threonine-protein kinase